MVTPLNKVIIVLTRPLGYVRKESLTGITRLCYPRYKNLHRTVEMRNENYNRRIEQIHHLEREGKVFVLPLRGDNYLTPRERSCPTGASL